MNRTETGKRNWEETKAFWEKTNIKSFFRFLFGSCRPIEEKLGTRGEIDSRNRPEQTKNQTRFKNSNQTEQAKTRPIRNRISSFLRRSKPRTHISPRSKNDQEPIENPTPAKNHAKESKIRSLAHLCSDAAAERQRRSGCVWPSPPRPGQRSPRRRWRRRTGDAQPATPLPRRRAQPRLRRALRRS
jgi:hypothetical protein